MAPLFPRWSNTVFRLVGAAVLATPLVAVAGLMLYVRSPLHTGQNDPIEQPVQFDHRHHVSDEGIDCRYCHQTVERSPSAGVPATEVCMGCHGQIWNKSPLLDPVRASYFQDEPIRWERVHRLPDFVYFNHAAHVNKGVGCVSCHGRVDRMALVEQVAPLTMGWCLDCHRNPSPHLRPQEHVFSMQPLPREAAGQGADLMLEHRVQTRTNCTTCHR